MPYKRAAYELGIGLTELKRLVRTGTIKVVRYTPNAHPKIPASEIVRLTTPPTLASAKPRGKPARKRVTSVMSPEELAARVKML